MAKSFMKIKKGVSLSDLSSPPVDPQNGDFYYSLSTGLQVYHNNVWQSAGSGSGIGTSPIDLLDTSSATLPGNTSTLIDGQTLVVDDKVLFLGLTIGANLVYKVDSIDGGNNITWSAAYPAFVDGAAPGVGETVLIQRGTEYSLFSFGWNGSAWAWDGLDIISQSLGRSADIPNSSVGYRTNLYSRVGTFSNSADVTILDIDQTNAAATAAGLDLSYAGLGDGIAIAMPNAAATRGIFIDHDGTGHGIYLDMSDAAATGLGIASLGFGIDVVSTSLGLSVNSAAGGAVIKGNAGSVIELISKGLGVASIAKWQMKESGGGSITHKLATDMATDYNLEWPKLGPATSTVLTHDDSDVLIWRKPNTGDSGIAWTGGGTLTVVDNAGNPELSWDANAYIQVPGLDLTSNRIVPGSFQLTTGQVAYVTINRVNTPTDITVSVSGIGAIPHNNDTLIIARYEDGDIVFSSNRIAIGQSSSSGGSPNEFTTKELNNSAAYVASAGEQILANTSSTALTIDLPASPSVGDRIRVIDAGAGLGTFGTNSVTIDGNGNTIQGQTDVVISSDGQNVELVFSSLSDWRIF